MSYPGVILGDMSEYTWLELDPEDYGHLDALSAHAVLVACRREFLVIGRVPDAPEFDAPWVSYAVLHQDTEGFAGLEQIDGHATLAEARLTVEAAAREFVAG